MAPGGLSLPSLGEPGTRGSSHLDAAGGLRPAIKTHTFQVPDRAYPAPVQLAELDVTFVLSAVLLRGERRTGSKTLRLLSHAGEVNPQKGLEKA